AEAAGRRIPGPVDLTDLAPTVLDVFGLPPVAEMQGESMLGLLRGRSRRRDYVFGNSPNTECYYLLRDGWKFITPPCVLPMTVAERHLGPTNPPSGSMAPDEGKEYKTGPPGHQVTLHYDESGDPLGILDTIVDCSRLYDRASDPHERNNQAYDDAGELTQRSLDMANFTKQVFEHSLELYKELDDGVSASVGSIHEDQALVTLGYLGTSSDEDKDLYKSELPSGLRRAVQHPHESPDLVTLKEADTVMQRVRILLRDGQPIPENVPARMQQLGETLVDWALAYPAQSAQVGWRLNALVQLAQQAGVTVDAERWADKWRAWVAKRAKARGAVDGKVTNDGGEKPVQSSDVHEGGTPPR
ncbi:MAG TPA: hypothetical protein VFY71_07130, partial [Planctomycetota bacterium]|nr:hypothetical protein [Planctomycetota bacterium]